MKHPPEAYYEPVDGSHQWMEDELTKALKARGYAYAATAAGKGGYVPAKAYSHYLQPVPETESDINSGREPRYAVVVDGPDGLDVVQDDKGAPLLFRFDRKPYIEQSRKTAAALREHLGHGRDIQRDMIRQEGRFMTADPVAGM